MIARELMIAFADLDLADLFVGGVIGLGISALFFWLAFRRTARRLVMRTLSVRIVERSAASPSVEPDIEIRFAGERVERLALSRIAVWNAGWSTLDGADVIQPLVFGVSDGDVLRSAVKTETRPANGVQVRTTEGRAECSFVYLDRNDGFILEVLHTGKLGPPMVNASIKGLPQGLTHWGVLTARPPQTIGRIIAEGWRTMAQALLAVGVLGVGVAAIPSQRPFWRDIWVILALGWGTALLIATYNILAKMHLTSARRVPRALWDSDGVSN